MRAFLLAGLALMLAPAKAQLPTLDITVATNVNNELEVKVRPDQYFDGLFSSIVFTIRWGTASGASLGQTAQVPPPASYVPLALSGNVTTDGAYSYATFAGFGFVPLSAVGASWTAGTEYTLVTIPVINGPAVFEIADDAYSASINGAYYVSLNGADHTGVIYSSTTGVTAGAADQGAVQVSPNPTNGPVEIRFQVDTPQDVEVEVLNSAGQLVHRERRRGHSGPFRSSVDLSAKGPGVYAVNVRSASGLRTVRVVVR